MSSSSLLRTAASLENGETIPLLDPHPPQSSPSIGRTLIWAGVTLISGGLTCLGIYAAVRHPADNFNLAASIALAAASACACIFCGKKTLESRSVVILSPLPNDAAARTQEHVLSQIDDRLSQVVIKYYPHGERRELGRNTLDQIWEKIALLDSLIDSAVSDRDHYQEGLDTLRIDSAALKQKLQLLATKSPIPASSSGVKVTASPSPLSTPVDRANATGSKSSVDFEALQRRLLEELEAHETRVRVSISSAPSGQGTPQSQTSVASTPTKDLRSHNANTGAPVSPLNSNFSGNGAGSDNK